MPEKKEERGTNKRVLVFPKKIKIRSYRGNTQNMRGSALYLGFVATAALTSPRFQDVYEGDLEVTVAVAAQDNYRPGQALSRANIGGLGIGGAGFTRFLAPKIRLDEARKILDEDWQRHHYCFALNVGPGEWWEYGQTQRYPGTSSEPSSGELRNARNNYMARINRKMTTEMNRRYGRDWLKR